jgi:hypothetical protein
MAINRTNAADIAVQMMDIIQDELKRLHDTQGLSWRKIAALDAYSGIPAGTLCSIAKNGREPKNKKYRDILGLSEIIEKHIYRNPKGEFESPKNRIRRRKDAHHD